MTTGYGYSATVLTSAALLALLLVALSPSPAQSLPPLRRGALRAGAGAERHSGGLSAAADVPRPHLRPPRRSLDVAGLPTDLYHPSYRRPPPPPPPPPQLSKRRPSALRMPHHNRTDVHGYVMSFASRFPPTFTSTFGPPSFVQNNRKTFSHQPSAAFPFPDGATFKAIYPSESPVPAPVSEEDDTAPSVSDAAQTPTPDVHVVAMSVSTSVKKGAESEEDTKPSFHDFPSQETSSPCAPTPVSPPEQPPPVAPTPGSNVPPPPPALPRVPPQAPLPQPLPQALPQIYGAPEENFEVDEALSVLTNGRAHGRQTVAQQPTRHTDINAEGSVPSEPEAKLHAQGQQRPSPETSSLPPVEQSQSPLDYAAGHSTESPRDQESLEQPARDQDDKQRHPTESPGPGEHGGYRQGQTASTQPKPAWKPQGTAAQNAKPSSYVVEGRNFRKYRVEEKTPDGFIVGEYGVVSHDDGSLRGVRYTADSTINPRLIYDALVKFLSL